MQCTGSGLRAPRARASSPLGLYTAPLVERGAMRHICQNTITVRKQIAVVYTRGKLSIRVLAVLAGSAGGKDLGAWRFAASTPRIPADPDCRAESSRVEAFSISNHNGVQSRRARGQAGPRGARRRHPCSARCCQCSVRGSWPGRSRAVHCVALFASASQFPCLPSSRTEEYSRGYMSS